MTLRNPAGASLSGTPMEPPKDDLPSIARAGSSPGLFASALIAFSKSIFFCGQLCREEDHRRSEPTILT
jgi:hypothetical protein